MRRTRENVTFNEDGTELTFQSPREYFFDRDASVSDENDTITSINMPILVCDIKVP